MEGIVTKSTGSWYEVLLEDGTNIPCRVPGKFRLDDLNITNPIAVGDRVMLEAEKDGTAVVKDILPRKNYIIRKSPKSRSKHQILAANLDQAILMATLRQPRTSQGFIDRFLMTCECYHIPAILIFNKSDLYRTKEMATYETLREVYRAIGYQTFLVSALDPDQLNPVKELLTGKITLLAGHSGVGKSTMINGLFPGLDLKTSAVSKHTNKGAHATTFAEMHPLPSGGSIIDTPGLREFGIVDLQANEVSHYFPEIRDLINECNFNNCLHKQEPGCAVTKALEEGAIDPGRYKSYCSILNDLESEQKIY